MSAESEVTQARPSPTPAAGGIVIRTTDAGPQVLLIHRPRYDDWSLPKGHVDPGETLIEAAVREVFEETGFECAAGVLAGINHYPTPGGEVKNVYYWVMTVTSGGFDPNDEVDRICWATPDEALEVLTYDLDRDLIRNTLDPS